MTTSVCFGRRRIIVRAVPLGDRGLDDRSWGRNKLSRFIHVDWASDGQTTICRRISVNFLESAPHDALGNGVREAEFAGTASPWLSIFWISKMTTADPFDVANLVVGRWHQEGSWRKGRRSICRVTPSSARSRAGTSNLVSVSMHYSVSRILVPHENRREALVG